MALKADPNNGIVSITLGKDQSGTEIPGFLDMSTGWVYDKDEKRVKRLVASDDKDSERACADYAATYMAQCISANTHRPVTLRDPSFVCPQNPRGTRQVFAMHVDEEARNNELRLLATPPGMLAPGDVHIDRGLPGIAQGYALAKGIADVVAPPFMTPNQSDAFWTWNKENAFQVANPLVAAAGGSVQKTNPQLSNTNFYCVPYALGADVPTEVQSNADAPLQPMQAAIRMVMDKLLLARELRVVSMAQTSANFASALVNTIAAGSKWNGGASADPLADLYLGIEQSFMDVTDMAMSSLVYHWLCRSPAIQKYIYAKDGKEMLPTPAELSTYFKLPTMHVSDMKYMASSADAVSYVWGNHVTLFRSTAALASGQDAATFRTFRWNGGPTSDGSAVGGMLVRTFFDQKAGPRGGTTVIVSHYDAEVVTSKFVGALDLNAYQ